jgi:M6 family metalloprotease-like protein
LRSHRGHRLTTLALCALGIALAVLVAGVPAARAAAPSPKLLASMSPEARAAALQNYRVTFDRLHSAGVDKIYPQFALDMAKYPRQGVAHRNLLVVLCKFPAEGTAPAQGPSSVSTPFYVWRHYFSDDPNDGIISLREYYRTNSRGRLVISGQTTSKWVDMPHSYDYYANGLAGLDFGSYPHSSQKLAEDAMVAAAQDFGGDLRYFDNDGPDGIPSSGDDDGYIDAVCVIVPGQGGETQCGDPNACNRLWSHESGIALYSDCPGTNGGPGCLPGFTVGGVRGFLYCLASEYNEYPGDNACGTWFHEFSHTLGLADLYDNVGGNGLGFYSLMALGNYLPYNADPNAAGGPLGSNPGNLDAWSRQFLGFDDPVPINASGHYKLAPVSRQGGSRRIWTNGDTGTEYFIVENRIREGSDRFLPGQGMLVYHIDDTKIDNIGGYPNYRASIVQADSVNPLQLEFGGNYGDPRDFFPGALLKRSLTDATQPDSRTWAGLDSGIRMWNIAGKADGADTASFDLMVSTQPELRLAGSTIDDNGGDGYADANETDHLFVTVRNVGLASGALHLTLSTSDPAVTITNSLVNSAAIPAGGTLAPPLPFIFAIGPIATLPHDIPFTVNWSDDNGPSGTFDFTVTAGMASGLFEDFESGAEPGLFWTTAQLPGSAADEWHPTNVRARGTGSAKLGSTLPLGTGTNEAQTYASFEDAALVSPAFDLPPSSELVFYSYIDAESYGGAFCYDGGRVEISLAGGEWVPLAVDGGYGSQMKFDSDASLRGADVFSGSPQSWRRVTCDLTGYSGAARVRFRFASDYGNAPFDYLGRQVRYYEGWYVDDVLVQPRSVTGPTPRPLAFRAGPNPYRVGGPSSGSIVFRFSAPDGLPHPELLPDVRVFDVHGRLVRSLKASPSESLTPSEFRATWNAKDNQSNTCPSGIYFAKVDIQGHTQSLRLVLVH